MTIKWLSFIKKTKVPDVNLNKVLMTINLLLGDIYKSIIDNKTSNGKWDAINQVWHS